MTVADMLLGQLVYPAYYFIAGFVAGVMLAKLTRGGERDGT